MIHRSAEPVAAEVVAVPEAAVRRLVAEGGLARLPADGEAPADAVPASEVSNPVLGRIRSDPVHQPDK
jgi:hypothetical protein